MMMSKERFDTLISMGVEPYEHKHSIPFEHYQTKKRLVRELDKVLEESCANPYYVKKHNVRPYAWSKAKGTQQISIYFFDEMDYNYFMMKNV